jgi:hypothetical protein
MAALLGLVGQSQGHGVGTINFPRGPLELIPAPKEGWLPEKSNMNKKI